MAGVPDGGERFGVELIAAQIDALLRRQADPAGAPRVIRPLGALGDSLTLLGCGLAGGAGRRAAAAWSAPWRRRLLAAGLALAFVALSAALYRWWQLLPAVPYGLGAMALAWWATRKLEDGPPWRGSLHRRTGP